MRPSHTACSLVVRLNDFVLVRCAPRAERSSSNALEFNQVLQVSSRTAAVRRQGECCAASVCVPPPPPTHGDAQVVEMWETEAGSKEMKCQWFYRPAECVHESLGTNPGDLRRLMRSRLYFCPHYAFTLPVRP